MRGKSWMVLLAGLAIAGCGPGGQQGTRPPSTGGPAGTVRVSEKEWTIAFLTSPIKAGRVTFVVKNDGAIEHNFVIEAVRLQIDAIQPGQMKQGAADLRAGTYEVLCNIPGHKEAGMKTTMTVTP
jgi:uncharacterized cupredoxin-like copper-binding protein